MERPLLDLKRLWRDIHASPDSNLDGVMPIFGDLNDPATLAQFGFHTLEDISKHECLFLLGRPGAGKSAEIKRLFDGEVAGFRDEWIALIRCKEIGMDLYSEINREPRWREATEQAKPARLVLDGLDEGFLREPAYFDRLKRTLEILRSEHPKLRLLLTCRPGERNEAFEKAIHAAWMGNGNPPVFAIEPLSPKNQRTLAEYRGVANVDEFIRWIQRNKFEEFAAWPRSLEWLADEFQRGNGLNLTYTKLCQLRVSRGFDEDKRIQEAGRSDRADAWSQAVMLVASTLVFCGRKGIALDSASTDCLALDEMFNTGSRLDMPGKPPLTREMVREAVGNASHLMEKHEGYYRFQNQSDLEFLAAAMLAPLKVEQLRELFGCPDDDGRWSVFPQLATTAANLAAQSPEFFNCLLENDPRVLMRMDFASKPEDSRRAAVDAMLAATAAANNTGKHDEHSLFATLWHSKIEMQLESWLFEKKHSWVARHLAFGIAVACCKKNFWEKFWDVASAHDDDFIESMLPLVLMLFGKDWPKKRSQELAASPQNRLAGVAMDVLLDCGWKPRELIPFLREPTGHTFDNYDLLLRNLSRKCGPEDLAPMLDWVGAIPEVGSDIGEVRRLAEALFRKSIPLLHRQDVRCSLIKFLLARIQQDDPILGGASPSQLESLGLDTPEHRRALLLALAEAWPPEMDNKMIGLDFPVLREDYGWLLDDVAIAKGGSAGFLAKLAGSHAWQFYEEYSEPLEKAYVASAELRAQLPAADPGGICATLSRMRAEGKERHRIRMAELEAKRNRPVFNHEQYLNEAVKASRAGSNAWTNICFALSQPRSESDADRFFSETDIRQLAGWNTASEELRSELAKFARDFLLNAKIPVPAPGEIPNDFFGIVFALSLHAHRLAEDAELRAGIRPAWALALLRHCGSKDGPLAKPLSTLTSIAPAAVAEACGIEFRQKWERNEGIFGQLLPAAFSPETEQELLRVLQETPIQPETFMSGLVLLKEQNPTAAAHLAEQRLKDCENEADSSPRRAALAACLFIFTDLWERAWPLVISDRAAARLLLLEYGNWLRYHEQKSRLASMPVPLVAALFELSLECFPSNDMPRHEGGRVLDSIDNAYDLQRELQCNLESRGSHSELKNIYARNNELRDTWWTDKSVDDAKSAAHALRRAAPTAAELVRFLSTEGGTFVCDNDSLQRAVLASLRRFENALHPHHILRLWHDRKPRSEEVFQVEIADHLERDLKHAVLNMETKVEGRERADIRVEAKSDNESFAVTLEVKMGHSNDDKRRFRSAMRTQLRAYLGKQKETHGIYVVGWFFCKAFRPGALSDMKSPTAAKKRFDAQAKTLSTDGYVLSASVIDCRWLESAAARSLEKPKKKL